MGKDKALFEDDFGTEFEDVFGDDPLTGANDIGEDNPFADVVAQPVQPVTDFASKPMLPPAAAFTPLEQTGGDAMLPAISISVLRARRNPRPDGTLLA